MKKFLLILFVFLLFAGNNHAQDQHFSQFYASPMTLNPALTGALEGKYRFSMIYRDQWRKTLDNPYQTYSAAADFRYKIKQYKKRYKDALGVGVIFYNDKINQINFSTNQLMISTAYHKALNPQSDQFLSLGIQIGMVQRNINYDQLQFDDQFNGTDLFNNPTDEDFPENNFAFSDFQVGLHYSYNPLGKTGFFVGVAMHHVLEPETSFFYLNLPTNLKDERLRSALYRKYSAHMALKLPINDYIQLSPRALVYSQGPHLTINAGMNIRLLLHDITGTALHIGGWARPTHNADDSWEMDAIVTMLGIEHQNFLLGVSYDINPSQLSAAGRNQSTFEISVAYLGEYQDETVQCPKF